MEVGKKSGGEGVGVGVGVVAGVGNGAEDALEFSKRGDECHCSFGRGDEW